MIEELQLKNWMKHTDLTVCFGAGTQALLGPNEAGKTSILRAIQYAFFGARSLGESIEDLVTWGHPVASMSVSLKFSVGSVKYTLKRAKSGAALAGSDGVTAEGHEKVTTYIEKLLRASANVANLTMFVKQKELAESISSSSMPLIEKLADMTLIDRLINHVQTTLPSGNVQSLKGLVAEFEKVQQPILNVADIIREIAEVEGEIAASATDPAVTVDAGDLREVERQLTELRSVRARAEQAEKELLKLGDVADPGPPPVVDIDSLTADKEAQRKLELGEDLKAKAQAFVENIAEAVEDRQPREALTARQSAADETLAEAEQELERVHGLKAQTAARIDALNKDLADGVCSACNRPWDDFEARRPTLEAELEKMRHLQWALTDRAAKATEKQAEAKAELAKLKALSDRAKKLMWSAEVYKQFLHEDTAFVPPKYTYIGGPIQSNWIDYDAMIKQATKYLADWTQQKQAFTKVSALREVAAKKPSEAEENRLLTVHASIQQALAKQLDEAARLKTLQAKLQNCKTLKLQREATFEAEQKAWENAQEQLASTNKLIDDMDFHNAFIKRLREARPIIAAKLWNLVMSGVSHYFSEMRGVVSVVTKEADGFMIDGKNARLYSGSTVDVLALALRLMLQKTFLPTVDFLILDEAAAACDNDRELRMLGTLTTSGVPQVLLVTHSQLADSVADNLIQI